MLSLIATGRTAAQGNIEISRFTNYRDTSGETHAVGFVVNNSAEVRGAPEIVATFYARNGSVLNTSSAMYHRHLLKPGQRTPFLAVGSNVKDFDRVDVTATVPPADDFTREFWHQALEPEDLALRPAANKSARPKVTGLIRNTGDLPATTISVTVAWMDSSESLIGVSQGYSPQSQLDPGTSVPFNVDAPSSVKDTKSIRYEVHAEGIVAR
jgi:hypothetical protein